MVAMGTFSAQKAGADKPDSAGTHPSFQNLQMEDDTTTADVDESTFFTNYRAGIEAGSRTSDTEVVPGLVFSSRAASSGAAITIFVENEATIGIGDEIKVRLKGFGVPASISGQQVFLRQSGTLGATASNVTVSGKALTIEIGDMNPGDPVVGLSGDYEIRIRKDAGITNPATAGVYHVEIDDDTNNTDDYSPHHVRIDRSRKLSAGSGVSGSELTVSGTGYNVGISAIFIENTDNQHWDGVSGITYRPVGITEDAFNTERENLEREAGETDDLSAGEAFLVAIGLGTHTASGFADLDDDTTDPEDSVKPGKTVYQIVFSVSDPDPFEYWQYTPDDPDTAEVDEEAVLQLNTPSQDFEDEVLGAVPSLSGGKFSQTVTVGNEFDAGPNPVFVEDLAGAVEFVGNYAVKPSIALSKTAAQLGDRFDITFNHFTLVTSELVADSPSIGGEPLTQPTGERPPTINGDAPSNTATYLVPSQTLDPGVHQVKVEAYRPVGDKREIGTGDLSVGGLPLEIKPAVAVPGQTIVIKGSGFTGGGTIGTIHIGRTAVTGGVKVLAYNATGVEPTVTSPTAPGEGDYGDLQPVDSIEQVTAIRISQNGNWTASIKIPETVASVGNSVQVVAREGSGTFGSNRSAVKDITIPKPSLTLNPSSGRPGSTMTITGAGWTAESTVLMYYDGKIVTSINAHTDGSFVQQTVVPIEADVGVDNIELTGEMAQPSTGNWADKTATVLHSVPAGTLAVSPEGGPPGASITVSGEGFKAFTPFSVSIGGREVLSEASENTDGMGNFSRTVVVPPLREGIHSITVSQQGRGQSRNTDTIPFTVGDIGPAVQAVEDAFGDLIDNGSLTTVWRYDFDTRTWTSYTTDPETSFGNDLFELDSGDILYVHVSSDQSFLPSEGGDPYPMGWSLITLN